MEDLKNKHVALLGFGIEGQPTATYLAEEGARVEVFDNRPLEKFSEVEKSAIEKLKDQGLLFHLAEENSIKDFDLVVRTPGMPPANPWLKEATAQGIKITSATAIFFERCPGTIIGVTGTKGKGTTSTLIYEILKAAGRKVELLGNIGVPALSALDRISKETIVVFELSSFQLMELRQSPHIAVVLMVTQDHIDLHGTVQDYINAKSNIAKYQHSDDFVIANIDYSASRSIGESSAGRKFWISRRRMVQQGACVSGDEIIFCKDTVCEPLMKISEVALPGAHNLENICAAVMASSLLGITPSSMIPVLKTFEGLEHRLHLIGEKLGARWFDDSISTTPESAIAAIEAFAEPKILILGGSSKGADFADLGKKIRESDSIRAIIGIGDEWEKIKSGIEINGKVKIIEGCKNMKEVVTAAAELAEPGDAVILSPACASFDMFKSYKDRGEQFIAAVNNL